MPKIYLFHVTKSKNEVFSVIEVLPFSLSNQNARFYSILRFRREFLQY